MHRLESSVKPFARISTDSKAATAYDEQKLSVFANDGLIYYTDDYLEMTTEGSAFVRNVAASLDKLMLHTPHSYSKPL